MSISSYQLQQEIDRLELLDRKNAASLGTHPVVLFLIKNPQLLITLARIVWSLASFAIKYFFDKDGRPKRPWLLKVTAAMGSRFSKDLVEICEEGAKVSHNIANHPELRTL